MCAKKYKNIAFCIGMLLFSVLLSLYFMRHFCVVTVNGDSMQPSYRNGQFLFAKKQNHVKKNDIVVFHHGDKTMVKRVIALPNSTVTLSGGHVYVNDVRVYPYTYEGVEQKIHLSSEQFFVIGDNYQNSIDSRELGAIESSDIIGVVTNKK